MRTPVIQSHIYSQDTKSEGAAELAESTKTVAERCQQIALHQEMH